MERKYRVKMKLTQLDGGIPAHPDMVSAWLSKAGIQDDAELAEKIEAGTIKEEELEEKLEKITTTFLENPDGQPCIEARCVKAAIKQAAGVMGLYGMVPGIRELMKEGAEVFPTLIPVADRPEDLQTMTKVMHTVGPRGPVSAFKRTRFVQDVVVVFEFHVTDRLEVAKVFKVTGRDGKGPKVRKGTITLTAPQLTTILEYALKYTGFGANRSQGSGKGELVSVEEI